MSDQNEFIVLIKASDSLKETDIANLTCNANAFILCKYSFINYEIYINKFINKQLTEDEIILINNNSPKFNFTFKEIMLFINKIDIYIVDKNYLIHRGIKDNFLNNYNLSYFIQDGKRYLYFFETLKLFMIVSVKVVKLQNKNDLNNLMAGEISNINNNNNFNNINNININDNKNIILNCLILLYANERLIKKKLSSNIQNGEIFKCYLVNKDFINNFKNKFYYSNINNILTKNYKLYNFYDFLNNLVYFQSINEIQQILKIIKDIDSINKIKILPSRKNFTNNNEFKWPINFELVHEELFKRLLNISKISENEMNEIKIYQSQYKIYFGYSELYINYLKNPIYFFVYNYNIHNNSYNLFAIFKCKGNIFHELLSIYLLTMTFEQYLNQTKIDFNKKNIVQPILNSQNKKNIVQPILNSQKQKILEVFLFSENNNINNNNEQFQNIIDPNINNNIELIINNIIQIDNIQYNNKKEMVHCLGLENIGATCYMNATIQCLCHIRSLKEYFKNNNNFNNNARLTKCFCELINSLWTESDKGYFTPTNFKNLI